MFTMKSADDLWEHIAYVIAYAPDHFPYRDFIPHDEQMDLERAFFQLRQGVDIVYPEESFSSKRVALNNILNDAYSAYQNGDEVAGAHFLNAFQDNIFKL